VANKQEEAISSRPLNGHGPMAFFPPDLSAMSSRTSHLETVVLIRDKIDRAIQPCRSVPCWV
jgi:hypothetical protein